MAITVGQEAPDFEIPLAGAKEKFKLSDYRGKQPVVLLFFPLAWTGVCTEEVCMVRDGLDKYSGLSAKVVGISVDSPFALDKFKAEQKLNFDLASDFNRDVCTAYGAKYDELIGLKGVAKRSAFVISKDGKVLYAQVNDNAKELPDFRKVLEAVKTA
ncbi:MAG: redoxin domain-containing protein [Candidatus Sumerlaeaceae bacterium]|nr:redoxin domain-containing protein [Candidatus Sumerlaeaceae bacterium]